MLHSGNSVLSDAAAAIETLNYMSDRQLEDIGFTRENFVEKLKPVFWLN